MSGKWCLVSQARGHSPLSEWTSRHGIDQLTRESGRLPSFLTGGEQWVLIILSVLRPLQISIAYGFSRL